jgi:TonB-linked SusC/RagA family outer membrane protein
MPKKLNLLARSCLLVFFSLCFSLISFAQKTVTGKVTNKLTGQPLLGATVSVKGTTVATTTNAEGLFSINAKDNSVISVSVVGFETMEQSATGKSTLNFTLAETTSQLNEVVVTGYSTQRKKDITGSVAVVNVNEMKSVPGGTAESLLQGQASGVTVINSGVPGGGSNIRVRGITSIGSTNPLVLIDGTPGSMHDLNMNDIESIQVLKDAGAASIYGVRGSNGVVVITTKRGKAGKAKVTYDGFYGKQFANSDGFNIANTSETMTATQASYVNSGLPGAHKQFNATSPTSPSIPNYIFGTGGAPGAASVDPTKYALYTDQYTAANKTGTDWFHEIFHDAPMTSHTVSVSQGTDRSSFYMSLGYFDQQGTLLETRLKRYSARINTIFNVGNKIRVGENAYFFYKDNPGFNNQNEGNPISMSYRESPIIPVYDIVGNYAGTGSQGLGNAQNPVANLQRTHDNKNNDYQATGNVFAEIDFARHFTARSSFGGTVDNYNYRSFSYTAYENAENNRNPNSFTENYGYNTSWTWTNTLTYSNIFGDHTLKVVGGTEAISSSGRAINGSRSGYFITNPNNLTVDPNLWTINFGPPNGQTTSNINGTPYANSLYSLFARADYSYKDKYLLSATVRRDGSSVFAESQRFGVFPSVSAAWRLTSESFMKDVTWLNEFKLRGGWGKLGSLSNIGATNAYSLYGQSAANSYYDITGSNNSSALGLYASQIGNANTTWEEDVITNIGFDATLFKKWDFSFEWYNKAINGLLFRPLSDITAVGGATPAFVNAGNIENKGIDMSLTYHGSAARNELKWDVSLNFTSYNNKVVSLPPGISYYDYNSAGSTRLGSFTRLQPGQAMGAFFGYEQIGLFADASDVSKSPTQDGAQPGFMKFKDANGDGKIDPNDRVFFGNPNPDFTAGLNVGASYKGWDFSTFLYASVGNDVINYVRFWTDFPQVWDGAISKDAVYNSWTPSNPGAKVPKLSRASTFSNTNTFSSYYMEDGSFLRMKSLMVGYTVPGNSLKRYGIERVRFYLQALNLFTMTKYKGLDPELTGSDLNNNTNFGIDFGNYPANQKGFNIGVSLTF